ncbi:hypothetical protein N9795_00985 [Candidatus Pelagibacter sp.]|nr:hypothetical protein [Candidatus Pelagibacter sp.]
MEEVRNLDEINELIIKNLQETVEILKQLIEGRDRMIAMYEKQLLIQDKYIQSTNEEIGLLKNSLLR